MSWYQVYVRVTETLVPEIFGGSSAKSYMATLEGSLGKLHD